MGDVEIVEGSLPIPSRNKYNRYPKHIKQHCIDLYQLGYTYKKISEATDVPHQTIYSWCRGVGSEDVISESANKIKETFTNQLLVDASRLIAVGGQEDKVQSSSTLQLITSAGILLSQVEKLNNLSGNKNNYFIYVNNADTKRNNTESIKDKLEQLDQEIQSLDN